jgi:hypothetical protein
MVPEMSIPAMEIVVEVTCPTNGLRVIAPNYMIDLDLWSDAVDCVEMSPVKAFKVIKGGFEQLFDEEIVASLNERHIEGGVRFVVETTEEHYETFVQRIFEVVQRALPGTSNTR